MGARQGGQVAPHASVHHRLTVATKGAGNRQQHFAVFHHRIHRVLVRGLCLSPRGALSAHTSPYEAVGRNGTTQVREDTHLSEGSGYHERAAACPNAKPCTHMYDGHDGGGGVVQRECRLKRRELGRRAPHESHGQLLTAFELVRHVRRHQPAREARGAVDG